VSTRADWVALDLEATSTDPREAWILEIAAQDLQGNVFHRYVSTPESLRADHEAFRFTGISPEEYEREKVPPEVALREFLDFLGGRPLLGHNLLRYDLPLLERALGDVSLRLPPTARPALDTLRLAHLVFPTPPEGLSGYRLGDLHAYFSGEEHRSAHRAQADVEATWKVLVGLMSHGLPSGVARAWRELGLVEGEMFKNTPGQVKDFLATSAQVELLSYGGQPFPHPSSLDPQLLPTRRAAQEEMFAQVAEALANGHRLLIEAPTGTGKTKGYLYPALHRGERTWVATHTKVLQAQALEELKRVGEKGYRLKAALVKSPRDTLCPEALFEFFLEVRDEEDEELRAAAGVFLRYAALGGHDLEALPGYWHFSRGFREARDRVGTNPHRCREDCPFYHHCAFQRQLAHRREAQILVTNQAYLLANFLRMEEPTEEDHLVLDEAHHLEDVATEALTLALDHEELIHRLNRLAHPRKERGLLRDDHKLKTLPEKERDKAKELVQSLLPRLRNTLDGYTRLLVAFIKNQGSGDPRYGLTLGLGEYWKRLEEWPTLNREEETLIAELRELQKALGAIAQNLKSLMARDLVPLREYLDGALKLLLERRRVLGMGGNGSDPNQLHLSEWDPLTQSWRHLAIPIDVSQALGERLWPRFKGLVLTSATLSVPTEKDSEGFGLFERALGLEGAQHRRLPPSLPYEKAHLLVPRHLPEARESTLRRFQAMLHQELRVLLGRSHRSLSLFTSLRRLQDAKEALDDLPGLLVPLTRKEREDVASRIKRNPQDPVIALGSRSYMEGVDFPALRLVNLERIPFPLPSLLLTKRMERAYEHGLDKWWDYYLPKAALSFAQAFGRLIRDGREGVGDGAFILWDKKLLNATYQGVFYRVLPPGVHQYFPEDRKDLYDRIAQILGIERSLLPLDELEEEAVRKLREILQEDRSPLEKAQRIAKEVYEISLDESRWTKQAEAIRAALEEQDLVALLPTGFGKSLAFQLSALLQRGLTLVVTPLVALMKDQVDRLLELGLPVGAVHSLMGLGEQRSVLDEVSIGRIRLLYVSPERLNRSETLWKLLQEKHAAGELKRVVFDEAHCLVEWGFDFRPDYLKALEKLRALGEVPRSFFTATLTPEALASLKQVARLQGCREVKPDSFRRPNLRFVVEKARGETGKFQVLSKALHWLMSEKQGSAVVYTATRLEAERLAWALGRLFPDLGVEAYHAGLGALPRREVQERFMEGKTRVVVATTAFGMGIDKPDVRLVIHWRPPRSLEEYIQQSGRAGRDGKEAYCLLLYTNSDWGFLNWLIGTEKLSKIRQEFVDRLIDLLEKEPELIDYRRKLHERVYRDEAEEDESEAASEEFLEQEEDEEEETTTPLRRELELEDLESTLSGLERAGIVEYEYVLGKALLQGAEDTLEEHLTPEAIALLREAGYRDSERGDELDFSRVSLDKAQEVDRELYRLFREGKVRLYHYREARLRLHAGGRLNEGYRRWDRERRELEDRAKKRLDDVRRYAENGRCRAQVLLKHLGEYGAACGTCDTCAKDSGPWEAQEQLSLEELERAYRPLDTLLAFFAWAEENAWSQEDRHRYLGRSGTLMALRGKGQGQNGPLGRKYINNRFFGHLSFIKPKELELAFERAQKEGYLEKKAQFNDTPLYGLTERGKARVGRWRRQEVADGRT
jgi:ATP-dependent DNA helicase RecQ